MKTTKRRWLAGVICLAMGLVSSAFADLATAQRSVEGTVGEMIEILYGSGRNSAIRERERRVEQSLGKTFAFDVFVIRALGRNRSKLTDDQFRRVSDLTVDLMVRTYVKQFAASEVPQVAFAKAKDLGGYKAELASTVTMGGDKFDVRYRSARLEQGWRVYDILVEGVSLVGNYRKQFDSHFKRGNGAELIAKLEKQLAQ